MPTVSIRPPRGLCVLGRVAFDLCLLGPCGAGSLPVGFEAVTVHMTPSPRHGAGAPAGATGAAGRGSGGGGDVDCRGGGGRVVGVPSGDGAGGGGGGGGGGAPPAGDEVCAASPPPPVEVGSRPHSALPVRQVVRVFASPGLASRRLLRAPEAHMVLVGPHEFCVPTRYSDLRHIGTGAYGRVVSAMDSVRAGGVVCGGWPLATWPRQQIGHRVLVAVHCVMWWTLRVA